MARKLARGHLVCEPVSLSVQFTAPTDAANSNGGGLPLWIDYRGRLTDRFGIPQHGSFEMVFRIADDDGTHLPVGTPWTESHARVEVANGFFRIPLGSATPFPPDLFESGPCDESEPHLRFLEVTINGETVPRALGLARRARRPLPSGDTTLPLLGWQPGDDIEPKISYCIPCFERGWQARMTLARNLEVVKDDPLAELVFVNFSGDDGEEVDVWIRSEFAEHIRRNRLLYFRRKERFDWREAVAKNVIHRLATGDILVDLECDKFIGPGDSDLIRERFRENEPSDENLRRRIVANASGVSEAREGYVTPNSLIPNVIHFIFFGETPFRFFHYLSLLSAYRRARPDAIYVYVHREPERNEWWERAKQFVTIEYIDPPREHRGKALKYFQYKADIVRLEKLLERGGIYLDIDVLTLRAFDRLRTYPCVVGGESYVPGREGSYSRNPGDFTAISNAVMMSVPGSPFLRTWYEELEIDDKIWASHAVRLPLEIARRHPEMTHVEPVESFMPFDFHDEFIFKELGEAERSTKVEAMFGRSYCLHLWETIWDKPFLQEIDPTYLATRRNIFVDLFGNLDW